MLSVTSYKSVRHYGYVTGTYRKGVTKSA